MKQITEKGGKPFQKEKKEYSEPETVFVPTAREDILTGSELPILGANEAPLIFY